MALHALGGVIVPPRAILILRCFMAFFRRVRRGATGMYAPATSSGEWLSGPSRYSDAKAVAEEYQNRTGRWARPLRVGWFYETDGPFWLYEKYR